MIFKEDAIFKICIVDECGEIEWDGGDTSTQAIEELIKRAEKNQLVSLGLIDFNGDTYFGESQCEYILQNELPILKRGENIDSGLLDLIERGCKKVLATSWSYLKITRQS